MQRFWVKYDAILLPGICFPSVPTIVWGLTFSSQLESPLLRTTSTLEERWYFMKNTTLSTHTPEWGSGTTTSEMYYNYTTELGENQSKTVWSPNWNVFWNICFRNKQIKAQLAFSQCFSKNHTESQLLDEFCDNLQMNIKMLGMGEVKIFPFLSFRVSIEVTWNTAEFLCKHFAQLLVNIPFRCFEMTDKTSYFSAESLPILCSSIVFH